MASKCAYLWKDIDFPSKFSAQEFIWYATLNHFLSHNKNEMEADISNIFQDIKSRGEHADHTDFVQKLFGLYLTHVEFTHPVKKKETKNEAFELWLRESVEVLFENKKVLRYWERIFDHRRAL